MRTLAGDDFPALATILHPAALAERVLPGFGIGPPPIACRFFSNGFNHTYQIENAGGKRFYLRVYRRDWRTPADIRYELELLNHLRAMGFPAAAPLQHESGAYCYPIAAPEGTRYAAAFAEAPGPETSYAERPAEMAAQYGRSVAEMHNALEGFSSRHERFRLDLAHFIDRPLARVEPFLAHRPADWAFVQSFGERLRMGILALPAEELEQGACHGDLQGYHAKVGADGRLTFYDFDCGGYGFRAYDLAVFLWCCRLEDAVETRWPHYLGAYRLTRRISDLDLRAVPLFVCARYLWHIGVHAQNAPDWGAGFLDDAYYDTHLGRLREAAADYLPEV